MKTINTSDIKIKFGTKNTPPEDKKLMQLLGQAYSGQIKSYIAIIKWEAIQPFSDFQPKIPDELAEYFLKEIKNKQWPKLFVYQEGSKFIMSDDYNSYYLYKQLGHDAVLCVVLGDPSGKSVVKKGKPFILPQPTIEIIESKSND